LQAIAARPARVAESACDGGDTAVTIDLERCSVNAPGIRDVTFTIDPQARARLLTGLDAIDLTLRSVAMIDAHRKSDRERRPWVYLTDE
jgi:3-isopropylmalate/(R)-2-methylmalate dehydratase small subunit